MFFFFFADHRCVKNAAGRNTRARGTATPCGRCRRTSTGTCGGNRPDSHCRTINSKKYGRYGVRFCICIHMRKIMDCIFQSHCRVAFSANITAWIGYTKYTDPTIIIVNCRFIQWLKWRGTKSPFLYKVILCVLFNTGLQSPGSLNAFGFGYYHWSTIIHIIWNYWLI